MPTELEMQREAKAVEDRRVEIAKLAKLDIDLKLKQRQEARKAEIESARANLELIEKRNTEEDAWDAKQVAAQHADVDRIEALRVAALHPAAAPLPIPVPAPVQVQKPAKPATT